MVDHQSCQGNIFLPNIAECLPSLQTSMKRPPHSSTAEVVNLWSTWVVSDNWQINPGLWPLDIVRGEHVEIESLFP